MKLFLASEAKHPKTIAKLKEYIGGFAGKTLAYIPTAANGEEGWERWREGETWQLVKTLKAKVDLVQLEELEVSEILRRLEGKDIIWMAGGYCGYLMYWLRRRELDKKLRRFIEKGSLYVGSSAGAMITAKTLEVAEWYMGEGEVGASIFPGLGWVDFDFYPHFEDEMLPQIKRHYTGKKIYLMKNGEEILVEDDKVKVVGKERVVRG